MKKLTQKRLKELLHYNPDTGIFTWRISPNSTVKKQTIAGTIKKTGYVQIKIDRKLYQAHRLAFLYMEGYTPENEVDHIDRNPSNNRWSNLREASRICNVRNCKVSIKSKSGITGVYWYAKSRKWAATITVNKTRFFLGFHANFEEAIATRWKAEVEHNWPGCNSNSSAYLYLKEKGLL